jgi:hypothetical protein
MCWIRSARLRISSSRDRLSDAPSLLTAFSPFPASVDNPTVFQLHVPPLHGAFRVTMPKSYSRASCSDGRFVTTQISVQEFSSFSSMRIHRVLYCLALSHFLLLSLKPIKKHTRFQVLMCPFIYLSLLTKLTRISGFFVKMT